LGAAPVNDGFGSGKVVWEVIGLWGAALVGLVIGIGIGALVMWAIARRGAAVKMVTATPPVDPGLTGAAADLAALRKTWQTRRHDVRGALSPGLLTADRLTGHADEQVRRAGEIIVQSLQRAIDAMADPAPKAES
jgi:hypothetical protein